MPEVIDGQYITVRLRLEPTKEQRILLKERTALYTSLLNDCVAIAIQQPQSIHRNRTRMHHALYYTLRKLYQQLPAMDVITAVGKVVEALKSRDAHIYRLEKQIQWLKENQRKVHPKLQKRLERLRTIAPKFKSATVPLPYKLGYSLWRETREISVTTYAKMRARMQYTACEYFRAKLDSALAFKEAELFYDQEKHRWYLNVATLQECAPKRSGVPLGVDLGIENLITTDDGYKVRGDAVWERAKHHQNLHSRLQHAADNGSRSARRNLKQSSGRLGRFMDNWCHCIAKEVVNHALELGRGAIALERLRGLESKSMSKYMRKLIGRWPHAKLAEYITYKARLAGLEIIPVFPAHTSTTCSICGYHDKKARVNRGTFRCPQCGDLDADINAAKNIALRAVQRAA